MPAERLIAAHLRLASADLREARLLAEAGGRNAVADILRTKSGKITELAVRDVVHGREVKNKEALANPEALELFRGLAELQV